jgi:hypothetical protein
MPKPDLALDAGVPAVLAAAVRPACTRLTPATRALTWEDIPARSEPVPP